MGVSGHFLGKRQLSYSTSEFANVTLPFCVRIPGEDIVCTQTKNWYLTQALYPINF